jgi:hypothetical protein
MGQSMMRNKDGGGDDKVVDAVEEKIVSTTDIDSSGLQHQPTITKLNEVCKLVTTAKLFSEFAATSTQDTFQVQAVPQGYHVLYEAASQLHDTENPTTEANFLNLLKTWVELAKTASKNIAAANGAYYDAYSTDATWKWQGEIENQSDLQIEKINSELDATLPLVRQLNKGARILCISRDFIKLMKKLEKFEEMGSHLSAVPIEVFICRQKSLLFISHKWEGDNPDASGLVCREMVKLAEQEKADYFWIDFSCIPQNNIEARLMGLNMIPTVLRISNVHIVKGSDTVGYDISAWCQVERLYLQDYLERETWVTTREKVTRGKFSWHIARESDKRILERILLENLKDKKFNDRSLESLDVLVSLFEFVCT